MTRRPQMTAAYTRGTASNREVAGFDKKRLRPWTDPNLEAVRDAALALTRTHRTHECGGELLTVVSGPAYWRLLAALDRERPHEKDA